MHLKRREVFYYLGFVEAQFQFILGTYYNGSVIAPWIWIFKMITRCYYVWKWFHGCMSTNCKLTYTYRLTKCFCRASWRRPSRRRIMHYYITKLRANTIKVLYIYFLQILNLGDNKSIYLGYLLFSMKYMLA